MTVCTLIHLNDPELYRVQTLVLETIRVGFPNADILVCRNCGCSVEQDIDIMRRCEDIKAEYRVYSYNISHASWIHRMLEEHKDGPLMIVDPDVIFWEKWNYDYPFHPFLRGRLIPRHLSEFGGDKCHVICEERIHSSLMFFHDPKNLLETLKSIDPRPEEFRYPNLFPIDFFRPMTVWKLGECHFFDTCANLYGAVNGRIFTEKEMDCYDHVGSACCYQEVRACAANKDALDHVFHLAKTDPSKLKGLWREQVAYYENRARRMC